jgi:hypothetical protein
VGAFDRNGEGFTLKRGAQGLKPTSFLCAAGMAEAMP